MRCPDYILNRKTLYDVNWTKIQRLLRNPVSPVFADVPVTKDPSHIDRQLHYWSRRAVSFDPWYALVEKYREVSLTRVTDRLPAVSSLAATTECRAVTAATYIAGLWLEDLSYGLNWSIHKLHYEEPLHMQ
jgi:hypothetical protein